MKKIDLGQTIQVLANVGVLVGLIVLIVEVDQNNDLLATQTRAVLMDSRSQDQDAIVENRGGLADLLVKSSSGEPLTDVERRRMTARRFSILSDMRDSYALALDGAVPLSDLDLAGWAAAFRNDSGMVEAWAQMRGGQDPDFVTLIEEEVIDGQFGSE